MKHTVTITISDTDEFSVNVKINIDPPLGNEPTAALRCANDFLEFLNKAAALDKAAEASEALEEAP